MMSSRLISGRRAQADGDRLVRTVQVLEQVRPFATPNLRSTVGVEDQNRANRVFRIQALSECKSCTGSCGWQRQLPVIELGSELIASSRNDTIDNVRFAVSRRGLSLASGLVFGMPLLVLMVAALYFDGRLGGSLMSLASFSVFICSLVCIGMLTRKRFLRLDDWLCFEMIGSRTSSLPNGNE